MRCAGQKVSGHVRQVLADRRANYRLFNRRRVNSKRSIGRGGDFLNFITGLLRKI